MVGRSINTFYPERNISIGEEVLRVEDLAVEHPRIAGRNVIEGISFSLRRGEVLGIAGLSELEERKLLKQFTESENTIKAEFSGKERKSK